MGIGADLAVVMEGVSASVAALDLLTREDDFLAAGIGTGADVDVLQRRYELCLGRLEVVARLEAQLAAVKARDVADAIGFQRALLRPDAPVEERTFAVMSVVEEIAGVLTISSGVSGALVEQSRRVCSLPPVVEALAAGDMSWQHARIVADETEGLTPEGAAGLVAHFFDPDAPNPARGAAPGDLVPSRFRAKVRAWRERHHPETLEKRHAKGVADRRMDYAPDRDGMAWLSLYLPGDTACAIWNRSTATARGLQTPTEPRTLTQLRADVAASLLLGAGLQPTTKHTVAAADTEPAAAAAGSGNDASPGCASTDIGKIPTPRADVLVTVPVFSLLGLTDEPAVLDGFGPVPASMARKLVAGGAETFYRVLVDPRDGAPLEIGRTRTGSRRPSNNGSGYGTPNAPSPAAPTTHPTTTPTTSPPGTTAAPPEPTTSPNSAPDTTASNTTAPGPPTQPPKTNHPAGPHPPADTTNPNNTTPNQPTGHQKPCRLPNSQRARIRKRRSRKERSLTGT